MWTYIAMVCATYGIMECVDPRPKREQALWSIGWPVIMVVAACVGVYFIARDAKAAWEARKED